MQIRPNCTAATKRERTMNGPYEFSNQFPKFVVRTAAVGTEAQAPADHHVSKCRNVDSFAPMNGRQMNCCSHDNGNVLATLSLVGRNRFWSCHDLVSTSRRVRNRQFEYRKM
jgi:hypothetical protein